SSLGRSAIHSMGKSEIHATIIRARWDSLGLRRGDQALAEGRRTQMRFKGMDPGKDDPIKKADGTNVEGPFLEHAETQPPGEVAQEIEIAQPPDQKSGPLQFLFQLRLRVPAVMAEVRVDGRVNLRTGGHKKAQPSARVAEEATIDSQLAFVFANVFQHVD